MVCGYNGCFYSFVMRMGAVPDPEGKDVHFSFVITKEQLDLLGLFEDNVKNLIGYFADLLGTRYLKFYTLKHHLANGLSASARKTFVFLASS